MKALEFWKAVTVDKANFLESLIALLAEHKIRYCVIGGQAVNAYAEPVVTLHLDLVIAVDQIETARRLLEEHFRVEEFAHSINVSLAGSRLRVQVQTDSRYFGFTDRATPREILDLTLPVAAPEDVLQGKIWAVEEAGRRASKRQKDLADIARLLEAFPHLRERVPADVLSRLL